MVSPDGETVALEVVREVPDGSINAVEFSVEGTVGQLGFL